MIDQLTRDELTTLEAELAQSHKHYAGANVSLDLTRGKPSIEQLELSAELDGILAGDYQSADGTDTRGYGGLDGLPEAKALAAQWLDVVPAQVLVGGNSSLDLMYRVLQVATQFGLGGAGSRWSAAEQTPKFLCPVPGYDRHFKICEELGLDMVPVNLTDSGPDMDEVEQLVTDDPSIKGIWCVPKYSNPTGTVYAAETVERIADLSNLAGSGFIVMWDNAYAVHHLSDDWPEQPAIMKIAERLGTQDSIVQFGSTSKVTFAGAGLAFLAASERTLSVFKQHLEIATIGPDKVNQLRHVRFLQDMDGVNALMRRHAAILGPKFDRVQRSLTQALDGKGMGSWTRPGGGYFVSFDARPGLARQIVRLAAEAGVKLTPAGAAYPYGKDEADKNIRLAPSFPPLDEVERAMAVFVCCVQLASVRQRLAEKT